MKCFEAQSVFGNPLDEPMILLKDVVEIFGLKNFDHLACARDFQNIIYSLCASQIGSAFVDDNLSWVAVACDGFLKETPCSPEVSAFRQHEIRGLSGAIEDTIEISPSTFDFYICLVYPPGAECWALTLLCPIRNLWRISNDPTVQCCMINIYASLSHNFLNLAIRNRITDLKRKQHKGWRFWENERL